MPFRFCPEFHSAQMPDWHKIPSWLKKRQFREWGYYQYSVSGHMPQGGKAQGDSIMTFHMIWIKPVFVS